MFRWFLVFLGLVILSNTNAFATPLEVTLEHRQEGTLTFLRGQTNLPDGTRLAVFLRKKVGYEARDFKILVKDGHFESIGFSNRGYTLSGQFEASLFAGFNANWQKPDVLEKLSEYEGTYIRDGKLRMVKTFRINLPKAETPEALAAQKAELDLFKKYLETVKTMRAELQQAAKDPDHFRAWSEKWNEKLQKEQTAFFNAFGKNVEEYKGLCAAAYLHISLSQNHLFKLWQKYDEFLYGRADDVDVTGKMNPAAEMEMGEIIENAGYSISECSPQ